MPDESFELTLNLSVPYVRLSLHVTQAWSHCGEKSSSNLFQFSERNKLDGLSKHNQRGPWKFGSDCINQHEHLTCENGLFCQDSLCRSRHLRKCRYFAIDEFCMFGTKYSYIHRVENKTNVREKWKVWKQKWMYLRIKLTVARGKSKETKSKEKN